MSRIESKTIGCPSDAALSSYHARELVASEAQRIQQHLRACASCAARADQMIHTHESWVSRLRNAGAPPASEAETPLRPFAPLASDEIPGYEILDEIARGGQGIVYRALQRSTRREVAIKVLREGAGASSDAKLRFEREIELVASLRHPSIVTVFDSGMTRDGRRFCVMDYVRGTRLDRHVTQARLSLEQTLELFCRVCDAINHAHQRGVMHRDVKPSNILVDEEGRPRVLDFGMARAIDRSDVVAVTSTGLVGGTLAYLSPEQVAATPDAADIRSDVYSLGVVLCELLTGDFPYPVSTDVIATLRHIADTPPAIERLCLFDAGPTQSRERPSRVSTINDDLRTIVVKALAKEPARRYQTVGDLARDLHHFLDDEPIEAKRDSTWYVLRKTLRRYRVGVGITSAFVLIVTVSAIALGMLYAQQRTLRKEAESQAALAQRRFGQVRDLANSFIFEFDPKIKRLPGAAEARELLVSKALHYLDALAADAGDDPSLLRELALAYIAIGDVQGDLSTSSLDNLSAALESYEHAERIFAVRIAADPTDDASRQSRGTVLAKQAGIYDSLGRFERSSELTRESLELARAVSRTHPRDIAARNALASGHERMGNTLMREGELDAAREHYQESLDIALAVAAEQPDDIWMLRHVGVGYAKLARVHIARGERDAALEYYFKFRDVSERLLAAHPENIVARRDVLTAFQWIGILYAETDRPELAIENFDRSITVGEALVRDEPDTSLSRSTLAISYTRRGEVELVEKRFDAARASFVRADRLAGEYADLHPERPGLQRRKGVTRFKLGELDAALARDASTSPEQRGELWSSARGHFQECLDVFLKLRERGKLAESDAGVPDEVRGEISKCDDALAELAESGVRETP